MDNWTTITTILPCLPSSTARTNTTTSRLLLRPLAASDLDGLHALRAQPEVMAWSVSGRPDRDLDETAAVLARFLPPDDVRTFNCAICLRDTGELVGCGGVHRMNTCHGEEEGKGEGEGIYGWPELGYMFKKEYWGCGMAKEFVRAFVEMWEALPREAVERKVDGKSVAVLGGDEPASKQARESLVAVVDPKNAASQRILEKCGFERFDVFVEMDNQDPERTTELHAFRYFPKTGP